MSRKKIISEISSKVKGGALYIAILVSIIIGIILCLFILIANYNQRNITVFAQDSQLYYNLKSGFQIAQSGYFSEEQNNKWFKNQGNDDSIKIKKINWGAYLLLQVETKNRHHSLTQSGLFGTYMSADTGLMVADNSRPVGLSGSIIFKSNCYLPSAGIKPAYIEGQSYVSTSQNAIYIKKSPYQIPELNNEIKKGLKQELSGSNVYMDSSVSIIPEIFNQSFKNKTVVWETSARRLGNLRLKNNIKLVCAEVEIDSSAHFDDILIVCDKARFKKGFKGKVHVIARDSISMEEDCHFEYPSSFVLLVEDNGANGFKYIQFNKGCQFFGGVLALNENNSGSNSQKVFVKLSSGSEVNGSVYSSDYVHVEGLINATLIANKLLLKTPSAVYENHILSCEINPKKYAQIMAVPLLFKQCAKLLCCEMIN
jgi:hypothetical protein